MRIALACVLVGCAYRPGSFTYATQDFAGQRVTAGCLDIAVDRRADLAIGPVLDFQFANRCDHAAVVDLGAVAVIGRGPFGAEVALRPFDPRAELHPAALDGRSAGSEALAYPSARPMPQICADAAALAHESPPRWLCFGTQAPGEAASPIFGATSAAASPVAGGSP
jgi:hypothetical protein